MNYLNLEILTTKELMEKLKVSRKTISNWLNEGMPCIRLGKKLIRYELNEVIDYLEKRGEQLNG